MFSSSHWWDFVFIQCMKRNQNQHFKCSSSLDEKQIKMLYSSHSNNATPMCLHFFLSRSDRKVGGCRYKTWSSSMSWGVKTAHREAEKTEWTKIFKNWRGKQCMPCICDVYFVVAAFGEVPHCGLSLLFLLLQLLFFYFCSSISCLTSAT